jgi:hypothetical protein
LIRFILFFNLIQLKNLFILLIFIFLKLPNSNTQIEQNIKEKKLSEKNQIIIDINLPNAPVNEIHPMNVGNKRFVSNSTSANSSKPIAHQNQNLSNSNKASKASTNKPTKSQSNSMYKVTNRKSREHLDEMRDIYENESNSLVDQTDLTLNQNIISSLDEKFNSDLYDTNSR